MCYGRVMNGRDNYAVQCSCGWSFGSTGHSQSAIAAREHHKECGGVVHIRGVNAIWHQTYPEPKELPSPFNVQIREYA